LGSYADARWDEAQTVLAASYPTAQLAVDIRAVRFPLNRCSRERPRGSSQSRIVGAFLVVAGMPRDGH
jgi:hypothetical protein